jgi:ArsR family transcriptional regulator, zinc-responsive transcriptional repressor
METSGRRITSMDELAKAAECLRTIAHPHRLRILQILSQGEHPVGALAEACELPSAMMSEHLRLMQRSRLLDSRRDGRHVYYFIVEPHVIAILQCLVTQFDTAKKEK